MGGGDLIYYAPGTLNVQNNELHTCESLLFNYYVMSIDVVSIILLSTVKMV